MNTETEMYLKCNLCDKSHKYEYSDAKYNAIEVEWIATNKDFYLLHLEPIIGKEYSIKLNPPLTLKMNNPFWAVYQNPSSSLNGIENEQDIKEIRFCKCLTSGIIDLSYERASIKVIVLDSKKIEELNSEHKPDIQWKKLIDEGDSFNRYGSIENFSSYAYLTVNIESDLGIHAIVKKENYRSYIVAINQWDFHLNEWILCKIPLNKQEEERYGIKYDV